MALSPPSKFILDSKGKFNGVKNPKHQICLNRDQALLTLIKSTLTPSALSIVVGLKSTHDIWNTLKKRYTSILTLTCLI